MFLHEGLVVRKPSIFLIVALITFTVGLIVAGIWIGRRVPTLESGATPAAPCYLRPSQIRDQLRIGDDGYFPEQVFHEDKDRDRAIRTWYARYLAQMEEPSFVNRAVSQRTAYRFLWLRSFRSTVVVRLWTHGERKMLTVKELSTQVPGRASELILNQTRPLQVAEWANFTKLLNQTCLWDLPTMAADPIAMDGEWWVLEGTSDDHYHVTTRQVPSTAYRELCLYMLKLSAISFDASTN